MLIINADDLGRNQAATDNILSCFHHGRLTSTSAMVWMADSERAATHALAAGIEVGLHVNLSESFTGGAVSPATRQAHERIRRFLKSSKYALLFFHPFLCRDFRTLFDAQYAEFLRLYRRPPAHLDGHQHMHLATNMLVQNILPPGTKVRRSFSFRTGEKSVFNRWYRAAVDRRLVRRHATTDYFFSLTHHFQTEDLARIIKLAATNHVELMTHPEIQREYDYLLGDGFRRAIAGIPLGGFEAMGVHGGTR